MELSQASKACWHRLSGHDMRYRKGDLIKFNDGSYKTFIKSNKHDMFFIDCKLSKQTFMAHVCASEFFKILDKSFYSTNPDTSPFDYRIVFVARCKSEKQTDLLHKLISSKNVHIQLILATIFDVDDLFDLFAKACDDLVRIKIVDRLNPAVPKERKLLYKAVSSQWPSATHAEFRLGKWYLWTMFYQGCRTLGIIYFLIKLLICKHL